MNLEEDLRQRGIVVEKILLRQIQLPKSVVEAINSKLAADQDDQRMRFVLEKEKQETERKRIEAQGIQDFQKIVSQGISEPLLRWKGSEATRVLAESPNTKIIVVGGPGRPAPDFEHRLREAGKMIDKTKRGDYEGSMHRWNWCTLIMGVVLLWTVLAGGCLASEPQVRDGNAGRGGETLEIKNLLDRSRTTVFDFFSPYCQPCVNLSPILEKLAVRMPEVAFVRLDINRPQVRGIDWKSPLSQQYRLQSVPYFMIFNPRGQLVAEGPEAQKMILEWLQKAGLAPQSRK